MRNQLIKTWWQEPLFALVIWFVCDFIAYASAHIQILADLNLFVNLK